MVRNRYRASKCRSFSRATTTTTARSRRTCWERRLGEDRVFVPGTPPRIAAVRARNVTATSADLHASIEPLGSETTFHFEYGSTRAYGRFTAAEDLPANAGNTPVSAHIQGLDRGTTYFRVVATNANGTRVSEDTSFNYEPPAARTRTCASRRAPTTCPTAAPTSSSRRRMRAAPICCPAIRSSTLSASFCRGLS